MNLTMKKQCDKTKDVFKCLRCIPTSQFELFVHQCDSVNCSIKKSLIVTMKTSQTQFEMMVTFMEQYGDLSKPSNKPKGRLTIIKLWDKLTEILNSDGSGESKPTDKWKKVWSDLKNNTKKKWSRINQAASGTGGGPALTAKLTPLEERVMKITGEQAGSGLNKVSEAGFSQNESSISDQPPVVQPEIIIPPLEENEEVVVYAIAEEEWNQAGGSQQPHVPPPSSLPASVPAASADGQIAWSQEVPSFTPRPDFEGQSPRSSRRRGALSRSPRRRSRPQATALEQATQHFLHSDEEWRTFLRESHRDKDNNEKERLRLRGLELQLQQQWQEIVCQMLDALHKIINSKLAKD